MNEGVRVYYDQGRAIAEVAGLSVQSERRDTAGRRETCPLEWISVALGS
jgi:hypothetical protein